MLPTNRRVVQFRFTATLLAALAIVGPLRAAPITPVTPDRAVAPRPITLPAIDTATLRAEDHATFAPPLRVGVTQSVEFPSGDARALVTAAPGGGEVWRATFNSPAAQAVRVRFDYVNLPAGTQLFVYPPGDRAAALGPYERRGPLGTGSFWTGVILGADFCVECVTPANADADAIFEIGEIVHIYRGYAQSNGVDDPVVLEGACHNDVMCHADWHPLHNAVGKMNFIDGGYAYLCTGTLLETEAYDETPYFLTANHCISSQTVAETLTVNWEYQTIFCDGFPAPPNNSSHADVLWTGASMDITLLMFHGRLPASATFASWNPTTNLGFGTDLTCISHPDGARKKITFGYKINHPWGDSLDFWGISWTSGTIEGGSSGSGVFLDTTQELVGVGSHSAGPLGCSNPDGPSGYGKFGRAYTYIDSYLDVGSDDALDDNDDCLTAPLLSTGTYDNLVVKSTDEDWYAVALPSGHSVIIDLTHTPSWGDVDIEVYDACGGALLDADTSANGTKQVIATNTAPVTAPLFVRVFLGDDTRNEYNLTLDTDCLAPAAPTDVAASDGTTCVGVEVTWTDVPAAVEYEVLRAPAADPNAFESLGTIADSPFNDTSALPGRAYVYRVRSLSPCGDNLGPGADIGYTTCAPGDLNGDELVNMIDFDLFTVCIAGPDVLVPPAGADPLDFANADLTGDGDVDLDDMGRLMEAATD